MTSPLRIALIVAAGLCVFPTLREQTAQSAVPLQSGWKDKHRVVIQVSEGDAKTMNLALNNAENLTKAYQEKGEAVQIEIVAYGPGLAMVRGDTSPVKERLASIAGRLHNVTFSGCGNTLNTQSKQENKSIVLVPQAHLVTTGIARIVELEEQGWTYIRP